MQIIKKLTEYLFPCETRLNSIMQLNTDAVEDTIKTIKDNPNMITYIKTNGSKKHETTNRLAQ